MGRASLHCIQGITVLAGVQVITNILAEVPQTHLVGQFNAGRVNQTPGGSYYIEPLLGEEVLFLNLLTDLIAALAGMIETQHQPTGMLHSSWIQSDNHLCVYEILQCWEQDEHSQHIQEQHWLHCHPVASHSHGDD